MDRLKLYDVFHDCALFLPNQPIVLCKDDKNATTPKEGDRHGEIVRFANIHTPPFITNLKISTHEAGLGSNDHYLICGAIFSLLKAWICKHNLR